LRENNIQISSIQKLVPVFKWYVQLIFTQLDQNWPLFEGSVNHEYKVISPNVSHLLSDVSAEHMVILKFVEMIFFNILPDAEVSLFLIFFLSWTYWFLRFYLALCRILLNLFYTIQNSINHKI
jgi:hypothetical protein